MRRTACNHGATRRRPSVRLAGEVLEPRLALTVLPPGFHETLVTTNSSLNSPTAMELSPTGQIWVLEQGGLAKLVRSDGTTFTALTLTVDSAGERGLLGIAFDPSYDGAGPHTDFVYLYYTVPRADTMHPSHNRISRFTVSNAGTGQPTLGSELVIRDLPPEDEDNNPATDGDTNHNGGALHFGPDGKLYAAVGDHNYDVTPQSNDVSQITTIPFGKILRLNPDGTNPSDNPFYTGSASDWPGSIYALGLRNPYTFAFQPGTGKLFINDVGESNWEEIDQGAAGANYGWAGSTAPLWEGFLLPNNPPPWANYHDPVMAYDHTDSPPTPAGVAITGGAFYPANSQFGPAYAGKYFFADFGANFIRVFDPANPGSMSTPDTSSGFASNPTTAGPVDLKVDAAGNLYYLARGGPGEVYRISFNQVVGTQLFYNDSNYDGQTPGVSPSDNGAIASDKTAYLANNTPATFANISSYAKGINGMMVDLAGPHGSLSATDFIFKVGNNSAPSTWSPAPGPTTVSVRAQAGASGSDRVELIWANGAIENTWLEVIVKGNDTLGGHNTNTGLAASSVFFFGSAPGDTGDGDTPTAALVSAVDVTSVQTHLAVAGAKIPVTNPYDVTRDGQTSGADIAFVQSHQTTATTGLAKITIPSGAAAALPAGSGGNDPSGGAVASALAIASTSAVQSPAIVPMTGVDETANRDATPPVVAASWGARIDVGSSPKPARSLAFDATLDWAGLEEAVLDALVAASAES